MEEKIIEYRDKGKVRKRLWTVEAQALKRIRISKKITREAAAQIFDSGPWYIERIENGRVSLTQEKISKLLRRYKVSHEDFFKIVSGDGIFQGSLQKVVK